MGVLPFKEKKRILNFGGRCLAVPIQSIHHPADCIHSIFQSHVRFTMMLSFHPPKRIENREIEIFSDSFWFRMRFSNYTLTSFIDPPIQPFLITYFCYLYTYCDSSCCCWCEMTRMKNI